MAKFDAEAPRELREVHEAAIRTEEHPKTAMVIWAVVADDQIFVRSVYGPKRRCYRDLAAGGPVTLEFAGRQLAVGAVPDSDTRAIARASSDTSSLSEYS